MSMTQEHLALAAGVSIRTVRRLEAGSGIGAEAMRSICSVLELDATRPSSEAPSDMTSEMPDIEFRTRMLVGFLMNSVGGCHPLLFVTLTLCCLWLSPATLVYFLAAPLAFYGYARKVGRSRHEALDFVRGRRFLDGEVVRSSARFTPT